MEKKEKKAKNKMIDNEFCSDYINKMQLNVSNI